MTLYYRETSCLLCCRFRPTSQENSISCCHTATGSPIGGGTVPFLEVSLSFLAAHAQRNKALICSEGSLQGKPAGSVWPLPASVFCLALAFSLSIVVGFSPGWQESNILFLRFHLYINIWMNSLFQFSGLAPNRKRSVLEAVQKPISPSTKVSICKLISVDI